MLKLNLLARSRSDGVFRPITYFISVVLFFAAASPGWAATVEYTLTIEKTSVNLTGKPSSAMTINGSIPGPVLRFKREQSKHHRRCPSRYAQRLLRT